MSQCLETLHDIFDRLRLHGNAAVRQPFAEKRLQGWIPFDFFKHERVLHLDERDSLVQLWLCRSHTEEKYSKPRCQK